MNYGKRKAAKKQKRITSKKTMQGKRVGVRLFKAFLLCALVIGIAAVIGVGVFAKKIIDNAPEVSPEDVRPQGFTTFVYADDGKTQIEKFVSSGSNRVYKTIDKIPLHLQHAFVAVEDQRFYEHNGIDLKGIASAAFSAVTGQGMRGASTLTQQLIKNNVFPNFVNEETFYDKVERKLQEQYIALQIEKQMTKDEILEAYMNTINLGQNSLGVQAAAKRYFGKDVSKLTLSESAVIAGITQSPSNLNPITSPEKNEKRRNKVLDDMLEQGYITQEEYDEAKADNVYERIQTTNEKTGTVKPYSYFVDSLAEQVLKDLQEQLGYTETQAYNALYSGGLTIYSTQNMDMQKICDEEMSDDSNYPSLKEYGLDYALTVYRADGSVENFGSGHIKKYAREEHGKKQGLLYSSPEDAEAMIAEWKETIAKEGDKYDEAINISPQPQASVTVIDQYTGEVKAIVGGRGEKKTSLGLNRATDSYRQPGSTFKILAAYGPALDQGLVGLGTVIEDKNIDVGGGKTVKGSKGPVSVKEAIARSLNSVAIQVSDMVTQESGFEYCQNFGINTLVEGREINGKIYNDYGKTMVLGGLTDGVYNYELCSAFASIANDGEYNTPIFYTKILDHDGNVLLENPGESRRVIKESTAALLTMAMQSVVTSGTGTACSLGRMPVAGKTGTTTNNVDLWFCGYTPYYTCAVWGGYDDNKSVGETNYRFRIWRGIMSRIHEDLEPKRFEINGSIVKATVCAESGLLPCEGDDLLDPEVIENPDKLDLEALDIQFDSNGKALPITIHTSCETITDYFPKDAIPTEKCEGHEHELKLDVKQEEEEEEEEEKPSENKPQTPQTPQTPTTPSQPETPTPPPSQPVTPPEAEAPDDNTGGDAGGNTGGDAGGDQPAPAAFLPEEIYTKDE